MADEGDPVGGKDNVVEPLRVGRQVEARAVDAECERAVSRRRVQELVEGLDGRPSAGMLEVDDLRAPTTTAQSSRVGEAHALRLECAMVPTQGGPFVFIRARARPALGLNGAAPARCPRLGRRRTPSARAPQMRCPSHAQRRGYPRA